MFVGYGDYNDAYQALVEGLNEANPYLCVNSLRQQM